jgi:hypothetical protein
MFPLGEFSWHVFCAEETPPAVTNEIPINIGSRQAEWNGWKSLTETSWGKRLTRRGVNTIGQGLVEIGRRRVNFWLKESC